MEVREEGHEDAVIRETGAVGWEAGVARRGGSVRICQILRSEGSLNHHWSSQQSVIVQINPSPPPI